MATDVAAAERPISIAGATTVNTGVPAQSVAGFGTCGVGNGPNSWNVTVPVGAAAPLGPSTNALSLIALPSATGSIGSALVMTTGATGSTTVVSPVSPQAVATGS